MRSSRRRIPVDSFGLTDQTDASRRNCSASPIGWGPMDGNLAGGVTERLGLA
jgi:hypothetical protein